VIIKTARPVQIASYCEFATDRQKTQGSALFLPVQWESFLRRCRVRPLVADL